MPADSDPYENRRLWRTELSATLALGWPLVLTNLAQTALTTADVILMGWLGPAALAAGALGTNLYFAFLIFGIGLMSATAPLIAEELGRKRHSVREVRRTVRQGLWAAVDDRDPDLDRAWNGERDPCSLSGRSRRSPPRPAPTCARCNGRSCRRSWLPGAALVLRGPATAGLGPRDRSLALPVNVAIAWC